jgi:hypothetical protein
MQCRCECGADGLVSYRVLVKTSDVRGAGTDGNVFITMYGPKGDSGEREIANGSDNFERNKLDTFIIKVCCGDFWILSIMSWAMPQTCSLHTLGLLTAQFELASMSLINA